MNTAAKDKAESDDEKAAIKAAKDAEKREAEERAATKAHLKDVLLLRGLARAVSPQGAESLADALDNIANALVANRKLDDSTLVEVAIALKNQDRNWGAMVNRINGLLQPAALQDRSVVGILSAVERGDVTVDQGHNLLREAKVA